MSLVSLLIFALLLFTEKGTVYELGDLFLEKGADINAPFIDSANAVCAAIPVGEMKINRGSSAEIRHVFNY